MNDINLDNAIDILQEMEESIREDIMRVPKGERSLVLGIMAAAMMQTSFSLQQYRAKLEKTGKSSPVTEEQKMRLRELYGTAKNAS